MPDFTFTGSNTVNRRPQAFREVGDKPCLVDRLQSMFIRRQRIPNPPQFSGTVTPAGVHTVFLRVLGEEGFIDRAVSDGTGYFVFKGTYDERQQYEFVVVNNDGSIGQIYHVDNPVYTRYLGNPDVNDSSGISRGDP